MSRSTVEYETERWFNNIDCYTSPHYLYIVTYCTQIFTLIAISIIIGLNIRGIFFFKSSKKQQLDKFIKRTDTKILYLIINFLYLFGIICYILAFSTSLSCFFKGNVGRFIFLYCMVMANASIQISAAFVYFFFIYRIKVLFLSQWTYILQLFVAVFIAQIICQIASVIFYATSKMGEWDYALGCSLAFSSLNVTFNTILIIYFLYKIYLLNKQTKTKYDKDRAIISFALRHLYSTSVCLISTNILGLMKIFRILDQDNFFIHMIQNIASSLDVFLTLFFLLIQFQFADYIYFKLSCCCDYIVKYYINSKQDDDELTTTKTIDIMPINKEITWRGNTEITPLSPGIPNETTKETTPSSSDKSRTTTSELERHHQLNIKFHAKQHRNLR
eukprot:154595_1